MSQPFGHEADAIVVVGIFDGAIARAIDAVGDIAEATISFESPAPFLFFVPAGRNGGVFEHRLEGKLIVDALQSLCISVGNHHFGVRPTLRSSVAVAASRVGHVAFAPIDVEQRVDEVALTVGVEQRDERRGSAIGVPNGIIIVIIRCISPLRIFIRPVNGHNHSVVEGRIKHALVGLRFRFDVNFLSSFSHCLTSDD